MRDSSTHRSRYGEPPLSRYCLIGRTASKVNRTLSGPPLEYFLSLRADYEPPQASRLGCTGVLQKPLSAKS